MSRGSKIIADRMGTVQKLYLPAIYIAIFIPLQEKIYEAEPSRSYLKFGGRLHPGDGGPAGGGRGGGQAGRTGAGKGARAGSASGLSTDRTRQPREAMMDHRKISEIKAKLAQGSAALTQADIAWLGKRVEELAKENEWLRRELSYAEHQGEVSF